MYAPAALTEQQQCRPNRQYNKPICNQWYSTWTRLEKNLDPQA